MNTSRGKNVSVVFCDNGVWGSRTARWPRVYPHSLRRNMGEVPGGRGTYCCAEGHNVADTKASQEGPLEEDAEEGGG